MITNKYINLFIEIGLVFVIIFGLLFMFKPEVMGIVAASSAPEYAEKLFDKESVSTIDIQIDEDEWDEMLQNAINEEYVKCNLVINGETFYNVGIRPKGNTSLTQVASDPDTDRFSFKFEFDQYVKGQTYYGLDKLIVNNMFSDATYMKEYLSYDLMAYMGVTTPLYAFTNITVNGEPWGLYLALEGLEESFAQRNFGTNYGQLYKPETMNMGGGGGGMDRPQDGNMQMPAREDGAGGPPELPAGDDGTNSPPELPAGDDGTNSPPELPAGDNGTNSPPELPAGDNGTNSPPELPAGDNGTNGQPGVPAGAGGTNGSEKRPNANNFGGMGGNAGGSDLVYTDDEIESYSVIFDSAVFKTTDTDYQRVIKALKKLNSGEELEKYIDVDSTLRYFAVNTVLVNLDSYVSNMKHNYYLYEQDGKLSILPWDYNLAFGAFQAGSATSAVNFPIDTPVSGVDLSERPMIGKLLEVDAYKEQYHAYLQEIVDGYFNSGTYAQTIEKLDTLIGEYVANDPTAFYTYEEYSEAVPMLKEFGLLRAQSIEGQLNGTIPSTTEAQKTANEKLVDASHINLNTLGMQGGGGRNGDKPGNEVAKQEGMQGDDSRNGNKLGNEAAGEEGNPKNRPTKVPGGKDNQQGNTEGITKQITGTVVSSLLLIGGLIFVTTFKRRK